MREAFEDSKVRESCQQTARHHDFLATDAIGQRAEHDEERRSNQQRCGNDEIRRFRIDLQNLLEEEQCIELPAVPHHSLTCSSTEQREQHHLEIAPLTEGLTERRL